MLVSALCEMVGDLFSLMTFVELCCWRCFVSSSRRSWKYSLRTVSGKCNCLTIYWSLPVAVYNFTPWKGTTLISVHSISIKCFLYFLIYFISFSHYTCVKHIKTYRILSRNLDGRENLGKLGASRII